MQNNSQAHKAINDKCAQFETETICIESPV